jgi:hypothetical protein
MRAAKAGDLRLIKSLVENGADPSMKLANGTTAMSLTLAGRGSRILTPDAPMFQAVRLLLEHGADPNAPTNGSPLLHQSLDRGEAFVRLLVEKGAKLDLKDATGRTPLDIALGVPPAPVAAPAAGAAGPAGRGARGAAGARGAPGARGGAPGAPTAAPVIDAATIALLKELSAK